MLSNTASVLAIVLAVSASAYAHAQNSEDDLELQSMASAKQASYLA